MISVFQAVVLGLLQGVSELFPISSLGHSVIVPALLGWQIEQNNPYFLPFLVATHLATALALLVFFWREWVRIVVGIVRSITPMKIAGDPDARLGWLLVIGTIPAGLLGLAFQNKLETLFSDPKLVAAFLFCNGVLLFGAEWLRRRSRVGGGSVRSLSWGKAFGVGIMQSLALFPGFSRTGAALSGGLMADLPHEDAARFSFLLATPLIGAAALLELPKFLHAPSGTLVPALIGALCAAAAAYLSVRFLVRYFKTNTLIPFAIYCLAAGAICFLIL